MLAVAMSIVVYACLLERVRLAHTVRIFGGAREPWWFGYARDGVTVVGGTMLVTACWMLGLPEHLALLLGCLAALTEWGLHEALSEKLQVRRPLLSSVLISLLVILPIALQARALAPRLDRVLAALF